MNYIINQSKLKSVIKEKFGIDLTGHVELDPNIYKLLNDFDECTSYETLYRRKTTEHYGPIFLIKLSDNLKIMCQKNLNTNLFWIMNNGCELYDESDLMDLFGIRALGLTLEQFFDLYI